jgi:outer membrane biogenesis lipoprotein LolB
MKIALTLCAAILLTACASVSPEQDRANHESYLKAKYYAECAESNEVCK